MIIVFARTIILYIMVVVIMRMMGKRQIGELQPFEFVITLMIAELASIPMENIGIPLINGLIPLITLLFLQIALSFILLKNEKVRNVVCGVPSIMVDNGRIVESELIKQQYSINDLLEQLRTKDCSNIYDIKYAILETNGELSVILKPDVRPLTPKDMNIKISSDDTPIAIIVDGKINNKNLLKTKYTEKSLRSELKKNKISDINDIFFCSCDPSGNIKYQLREKKGEPK